MSVTSDRAMRRTPWRLGALVVCCCAAAASLGAGDDVDGHFDISYAPGMRDGAGRFMGGTEIRALAGHEGRLYAGNHHSIDLGYRSVDAGAWYLVRHPDARYELHRVSVAEQSAGTPRVGTRTIRVSPFADDATIYFGGYDANKVDAHNTAWIVRGNISTVLGPSSHGGLVR